MPSQKDRAIQRLIDKRAARAIPEDDEASFFEQITDPIVSLKSGTENTIGSLLSAGGFSARHLGFDDLAESMSDAGLFLGNQAEDTLEGLSEEGKREREKRFLTTDFDQSKLTDPGAFTNTIAEAIPSVGLSVAASIATGAAIGSLLGPGGFAAGAAVGLTAATIVNIAKAIGFIVGGLTEGAQSGGFSALEASQAAEEVTDGQLETLDGYGELIATGATNDDIRDIIRDNLQDRTVPLTFLITSLLGGIAGKFHAGTAAKKAPKRFAQGAIPEALTEAPQSFFEQIIGNVGFVRPTFEGSAEAAAAGLFTGGAIGGGLTSLSSPGKPDVDETPANRNKRILTPDQIAAANIAHGDNNDTSILSTPENPESVISFLSDAYKAKNEDVVAAVNSVLLDLYTVDQIKELNAAAKLQAAEILKDDVAEETIILNEEEIAEAEEAAKSNTQIDDELSDVVGQANTAIEGGIPEVDIDTLIDQDLGVTPEEVTTPTPTAAPAPEISDAITFIEDELQDDVDARTSTKRKGTNPVNKRFDKQGNTLTLKQRANNVTTAVETIGNELVKLGNSLAEAESAGIITAEQAQQITDAINLGTSLISNVALPKGSEPSVQRSLDRTADDKIVGEVGRRGIGHIQFDEFTDGAIDILNGIASSQDLINGLPTEPISPKTKGEALKAKAKAKKKAKKKAPVTETVEPVRRSEIRARFVDLKRRVGQAMLAITGKGTITEQEQVLHEKLGIPNSVDHEEIVRILNKVVDNRSDKGLSRPQRAAFKILTDLYVAEELEGGLSKRAAKVNKGKKRGRVEGRKRELDALNKDVLPVLKELHTAAEEILTDAAELTRFKKLMFRSTRTDEHDLAIKNLLEKNGVAPDLVERAMLAISTLRAANRSGNRGLRGAVMPAENPLSEKPEKQSYHSINIVFNQLKLILGDSNVKKLEAIKKAYSEAKQTGKWKAFSDLVHAHAITDIASQRFNEAIDFLSTNAEAKANINGNTSLADDVAGIPTALTDEDNAELIAFIGANSPDMLEYIETLPIEEQIAMLDSWRNQMNESEIEADTGFLGDNLDDEFNIREEGDVDQHGNPRSIRFGTSSFLQSLSIFDNLIATFGKAKAFEIMYRRNLVQQELIMSMLSQAGTADFDQHTMTLLEVVNAYQDTLHKSDPLLPIYKLYEEFLTTGKSQDNANNKITFLMTVEAANKAFRNGKPAKVFSKEGMSVGRNIATVQFEDGVAQVTSEVLIDFLGTDSAALVLAHEIAHNFTTQAVLQVKEMGNAAPASSRKAVADILALMKRVNKHIQNNPDIDPEIYAYAMRDIDEFVAVSYSDLQFQQFLTSIPADKGNLWQQLKDIYKRLIHGASIQKDILDQLFTASQGLILSNAQIQAIYNIDIAEQIAHAQDKGVVTESTSNIIFEPISTPDEEIARAKASGIPYNGTIRETGERVHVTGKVQERAGNTLYLTLQVWSAKDLAFRKKEGLSVEGLEGRRASRWRLDYTLDIDTDNNTVDNTAIEQATARKRGKPYNGRRASSGEAVHIGSSFKFMNGVKVFPTWKLLPLEQLEARSKQGLSITGKNAFYEVRWMPEHTLQRNNKSTVTVIRDSVQGGAVNVIEEALTNTENKDAALDMAAQVLGDTGTESESALRKFGLGFMMLDQIERAYSPMFEGTGEIGSNPLKRTVRGWQNRQALAKAFVRLHDRIFTKWRKVAKAHSKDESKMNGLMLDTTLAGVFPDLPWSDKAHDFLRAIKNKKSVLLHKQNHTELQGEFNKLHPVVQKLYTTIRKFYKTIYNEFRVRSIEKIARTVGVTDAKLINDLTNAKTGDAVDQLTIQQDSDIGTGKIEIAPKGVNAKRGQISFAQWKDLKTFVLQMNTLLDSTGPYFPLRRFGEFVFDITIPTIVGTFENNKAARARQQELKVTDPTLKFKSKKNDDGTITLTKIEYAFFSFDSEPEVKRAYAGMVAQLGNTEGVVINQPTTKRNFNYIPSDTANLLLRIAKRNLKSDGDAEITAALKQGFMHMMPESSLQKRLMRRSKTLGASKNMQRTFTEYVQAAGWALGDMEAGEDIAGGLSDLQAAPSKVKGEGAGLIASAVVHEINERNKSLDRTAGGFTRAVAGVGFVWYLMNISYSMVNSTQVFTMTVPHLSGEYGTAKASAAILGAYNLVSGEVLKKIVTTGFGTAAPFTDVNLESVMDQIISNVKKSKSGGEGTANMLQQLADEDIVSATFTLEVYEASKGDSNIFNSVLEMGRVVPHLIEIMNRSTTAIATYNLEMERLAKKPSSRLKASHDIATDVAREAVRKTQFDYTELNRPRFFTKNDFLRAVTMFKIHPVGVYGFMIDNMVKARKGKTREQRRKAFKTLIVMMGTHTAMAGVAGGVLIEPVRAAMGLLSMAIDGFDDDDKELQYYRHILDNPEIVMSQFLYEALGDKDLARTIVFGVPNALGFDMHRRIGLHNLMIMWGRGSPTSYKFWRDSIINSSIGPVLGLEDGIGKFFNHLERGGDLWRASEFIAPKQVRDIMATARFADKGMTDLNGNVIKDASTFTPRDLIVRMIGFSSTSESEIHFARNYINKRTRAMKGTKNALMNKWRQAPTLAERSRIWREEIQPFNRTLPKELKSTYNITRSALLKSSRTIKTRRRHAVVGTVLPNIRTKKFFEKELSFTSPSL